MLNYRINYFYLLLYIFLHLGMYNLLPIPLQTDFQTTLNWQYLVDIAEVVDLQVDPDRLVAPEVKQEAMAEMEVWKAVAVAM